MHSQKLRLLLCLPLLGAALSQCGSKNLPDYVKLGPLRVLSIKVSDPGNPTVSEFAPGTAVTLTPLVSWVDSAGANVTWTTEACRDPGIAYGAVPSCDAASDKVTIAAGAGGTGTQAIGNTGNAFTATLPPITVTIPANVFVTPLPPISPTDQTAGWAYLVIFKLTGGGETVTTAKRIVVTTRTGADLNTHPTLGPIQADGVALAAPLPTQKVVLSAAPSGLQTTSSPADDPVITWFFSDGEYQRFRTTTDTTTNEWTPPTTAPTGRAVTVVAVLRDGRGGEDFQQVSFP